MLVSPADLPVSETTEVPEFRTLTATKRDTFIALVKAYSTYSSPSGQDVIKQVGTLNQDVCQQTIYRALDELVDDGYAIRTGEHSRRRTFRPTKAGLAAYCRAREQELCENTPADPTLASFS